MLGLREKLFISDVLTIRARRNFHAIRPSFRVIRRLNFRRANHRHSNRYRSIAEAAPPNFHSAVTAAKAHHHNSAALAPDRLYTLAA